MVCGPTRPFKPADYIEVTGIASRFAQVVKIKLAGLMVPVDAHWHRAVWMAPPARARLRSAVASAKGTAVMPPPERRGPNQRPPARLLTFADLHELVPISRQTIRRMVAEGTFPAPVHLSRKRQAWREDDIQGWLARGGRKP
jgi:predicted DNA-binding transcriptional regulator AlpA